MSDHDLILVFCNPETKKNEYEIPFKLIIVLPCISSINFISFKISLTKKFGLALTIINFSYFDLFSSIQFIINGFNFIID